MKLYKKPDKRTLKRKLDKLFSLWVRRIGYCQLAGLDGIKCSPQLQCMHIETRGNLTLRFDPMNAICGCSGHHVFYTYHERRFKEIIKKHFRTQWNWVEKHQNERTNYTIEDYQRMIEKFSGEGV